jgi:hypothetical protein
MEFPEGNKIVTCKITINIGVSYEKDGISIKSPTGKVLWLWLNGEFTDDDRRLIYEFLPDFLHVYGRTTDGDSKEVMMGITTRQMAIFKYLVDRKEKKKQDWAKRYRKKK